MQEITLVLKPNRKVLVKKNLPKKPQNGSKPPFWIPATGYYVLCISATGIIFFVLLGIWGIEETPLMFSGIIACTLLGGAVILREVVFKERRRAIVLAQKRIDDNVVGLVRRTALQPENLLTTEQNQQLVETLKDKSRAAESFKNLPDAHREVFELCESYLQRNADEINRTGINAKKLQILNSDRIAVRALHKHHLLKWSVADSAEMLNKAKSVKSYVKKIEYAKQSLALIETALKFYPDEIKLKESSDFIRDFIKDEKVKKIIAKAEKEFLELNHQKSVENYQKALRLLTREDNSGSEWKDLEAEIKIRIERIETRTKQGNS